MLRTNASRRRFGGARGPASIPQAFPSVLNCAHPSLITAAMSMVSPAFSPAPRVATTTRPAPELTIVIPTFKERDNIPLLVDKLARTLAGIDWEAVFVDDNSPDGTASVARQIGAHDARVRCVR